MKKRFLLLIIFIFLLTGCSDEEESIVEKDVILKDVYNEVLNGNRTFIDSYGAELDFKGYMNNYSEIMDYVPYETALLDLNADGFLDMIVSFDANDRYYLVLHYEKKNVYGYSLNGRSIMNLKKDGTFYSSGGATSGGINRLIFSKNNVKVRSIASRDGDNYYIGDEAVTANRYVTYYNEFITREDVKFGNSKTAHTKDNGKNPYGIYYLLDKKGEALKDDSGTIIISSDGFCSHRFNKSDLGCKSFKFKKDKICFEYSDNNECYTFKNNSIVKETVVYTKSS